MHPTSLTHPLALLFTLALGSGSASAQSAPDAATTLPPVTAKAAGDRSTTEGSGSYTPGATSTATGLGLSLRETPQSVSVVTSERIRDQGMNSVADALRNTLGISLKPVDRGRNRLSARGFEVNNFQFDGVPISTGNIGIETAHIALYDRIEVVRGATGLLSGAGDPSAAVNLVRKHATSRVFTGTFSAELGSWNERSGTLDLSTPLAADGSVRARVVASLGRKDAFIDLENTRQSLLYAIVDADLGPATRLSVGASEQRDERNGVMWAGLPYWYSDGSRTDWDRSKTTATRWNQWDTTEQIVFATLEHTLPSRWNLRADLTQHRQQEDSKLLWIWGDPSRTTGLGMQAAPYHYITDPKQTHLSLTATGPFRAFDREHELMLGLMRSKLEDGWSNRDLVGGTTLPVGDFNAWDGSFPEPPMGERYVASRGTTVQVAAYGALRMRLTDRLQAIGGVRVSDWKRDEQAAVWTPAPYRIEHRGIVTPYAGLTYDLSDTLTAYASYADIFKPQTARDRNGAYLDPLQGKSLEAGLKAELLGGALNASAAVFRTKQSDFAVADPGFFVPGTRDPAMRAAEGVKAQGYELELTGELSPGWNLSAGWTQFSARDADDADVAVDHSRRQLKLYTSVDLEGPWSGLTVGGGVNWEGSRPATAMNPLTQAVEKVGQPAFTLVELMARYRFDPSWSLQLNVTNLFDKQYRSGSDWWGAPYTYGEPRKLLMTAEYAF